MSRAVAKITHHADGSVTVLNLTTGEEQALDRGYYLTAYTTGCAVLLLLMLLAVAGMLAVLL